MWVPVSDTREIQRAFKAVRVNLLAGAHRFAKHVLGSPGGHERIDIHWRRAEGFWTALPPTRRGTGSFRCLIGTSDPRGHASLDIDVEINLPREGVNRRYGGVFLKDDSGRVFLAHSGKIGGGHEGIGKSAFQDFYLSGNWQRVRWPDRKSSDVIVLGPVKHLRLAAAVAHFAATVARFKRSVRVVSEDAFSRTATADGLAVAYADQRADDHAEAACWQAVVVAALAEALENRALHVRILTYRHLVAMQNGAERCLFAVRSGAMAAGVGELALNAAASAGSPRKILVAPEDAAPESAALLHRLGIETVRYRWNGTKPVFDGLDRVL